MSGVPLAVQKQSAVFSLSRFGRNYVMTGQYEFLFPYCTCFCCAIRPGTGITIQAGPDVLPPGTLLAVTPVTVGEGLTIINDAPDLAFEAANITSGEDLNIYDILAAHDLIFGAT